MKYLLLSLSFFAVALLFWFCKHTRYTTDQLPRQQIRFGTGGGFVGRETMFTLLENGQVFKQAIDGQTQALPDAKQRAAKGLFKAIENIEFENIKFKHPGNTYSFIEIPTGETTTHRVTWGDPSYQVDGVVQDLFDKLNALAAPLAEEGIK
jgi:hypothetical protein